MSSLEENMEEILDIEVESTETKPSKPSLPTGDDRIKAVSYTHLTLPTKA